MARWRNGKWFTSLRARPASIGLALPASTSVRSSLIYLPGIGAGGLRPRAPSPYAHESGHGAYLTSVIKIDGRLKMTMMFYVRDSNSCAWFNLSPEAPR